ncbi:lipocalin family protein [Chitinibacter sp. GC72]|uniref:lipocalin family protein n=1 Tax=Chitinibacter sp. GC72 TaxID=1526917 RepID=UPI0012FA7175|nr:lipocalin family protein [Chitinibacter sp. GC72]
MLKTITVCSALLISCASWAADATPAAPVRTVAEVDLNRYLGQWYEIAKFPMYFQRNCVADTTANYSKNPDGSIKVVNRCRKESGEYQQAEGKATAVDNTQNSQLKVSFFWPFKSDYWIIGLDTDYQWAVVGNPERKYLWILSRTPKLSEPALQAAQKAAIDQGYDLRQLDYTRQQ